MRRELMGVVKIGDIYYARKYVPKGLQEAVARVLEEQKARVSWLKRSLQTKDLRVANIKAKPVLMEFDRVLAKAAKLLDDVPLTKTLSQAEIERLAAYQYAFMLEEDEEVRRDGTGSEDVFAAVGEKLRLNKVPAFTHFDLPDKPAFGLSDREMQKVEESISGPLALAKAALARGDVSFVEDELTELLEAFRIRLDHGSADYRKLGAAVLKSFVRALEDVQRRHRGEIVDTPLVPAPLPAQPDRGGTVTAALLGWAKARQATQGTTREFEHAVRRFVELHGNLKLLEINRGHVRQYREALQRMPVRRKGALRDATLPELVEWMSNHPDNDTISAATVNKLLGAVQAVCVWGRDNGLISDDQAWPDPFARMRLEEEEPSREPWEISELRVLFSSPVFTQHHRPIGGRGDAAYWLPLLALYTGARLGELAPLTAARVVNDEGTGHVSIVIAKDETRGVRLKTPAARRTIPVHPELHRLGFLVFVEERRKADGADAALFPLLQPGPRGGYAEGWSKWFGRYLRSIGIRNSNRVFHSLRHTFKDALRASVDSEELQDALLGHSGGGVGRSYGAKDMVRRFGLSRLAEAVANVEYHGLDLTHLYPRSPIA